MDLEEGPIGASSGYSIALADSWLALLPETVLFSSSTIFYLGMLVVSTITGFSSRWHSDLIDFFFSSEPFRVLFRSLASLLLGGSS